MEFDYIEQGDCLEFLKGIESKSIDTVFTSPPYNRIRNDTYEDYDDNLSDYLKMLKKLAEESLRIAKDKVIINIQQNHYNKKEVFAFCGMYADKITGVVIWTKSNPKPSSNCDKEKNTRSVTNAFEYFFVLNDDGKDFKAYGNQNVINHIHTSVNNIHYDGHGAVMKKEVADWFIKNFTKEGDIVLDPFLGTGTTAVSCIEQNRHYIGFEISEKYLEMADERIEKAKRSRDFNTLPIGSGYEQLKLF